MAPKAQHVYNWMREPTFGDLVLVWAVRPGTPPEDRVGVYDSAWTYIYPPEVDDGEPEDMPLKDRGHEFVQQIRTLDDRFVSWHNVQLFRIPRDHDESIRSEYDPCPSCGGLVGHKSSCPELYPNRRDRK